MDLIKKKCIDWTNFITFPKSHLLKKWFGTATLAANIPLTESTSTVFRTRIRIQKREIQLKKRRKMKS
jgi:hypothetical protein